VLQPVCERVGLHWTYSYTPTQLDEALAPCDGAPVLHCHVNANRDSAGRIGLSRGFHVIRDPRDVIVSGYYAHLHSHSIGPWRELEGHRRLLRSLSREAGLLAEIEFSSRLPTEGHLLEPFRALAEWDFAQPNVLELRFEALVSDPLGTVLEALGFLGLLGSGPWRISRRRVARLVEGVAFPRLSGGRARGQADPASHYRAGVGGEWRTHFGPEHKRAFEERHPGLLQRLGYEADGGW
jgi:hypothetical protein